MRDHLGRYGCHCAGGCPLHVFFLSLGPHRRILGRNKKTGPGGTVQLCSGSLFVETSHFLNISHQYPLWGIIYPSILQHTFEVLHNLPQFSSSSDFFLGHNLPPYFHDLLHNSVSVFNFQFAIHISLDLIQGFIAAMFRNIKYPTWPCTY